MPGVLSVTAVLTAHRPGGQGQQAPQPAQPKAQAPAGGPQARPAQNTQKTLVPGIKSIIAVASGKGGVGKSTVSANLAVALAAEGRRVGLLDADVYGPSQPRMLGVPGRPASPDGKTILPMRNFGVTMMSIGLMTNDDQAVVWRGPMLMGALQQMLEQVQWGDLDVLIVDLPPAEADELHGMMREQDIDTVFLVAPTTRAERVASIVEHCSGYLYYVSLKGVTGAALTDFDSVTANINKLRERTELPIVIGFGIKDAETAAAVGAVADAVVVGSALVNQVEAHVLEPEAISPAICAILGSIRKALDSL